MDTVIVTVRLPRDVYLKILEAAGSGHDGGGQNWRQGGVSKYLRERIVYDMTRKHGHAHTEKES